MEVGKCYLAFCYQKKSANLVCVNPYCQENCFICQQRKICDCHMKHRNCDKFDWETIIQKFDRSLMQNRIQFKKFTKKMDELFQILIGQMNRLFQDYNKWKGQFGLTANQIEFLRLLKQHQFSKFTGSKMCEIRNQLKFQSRIIVASQKQFNQSCKAITKSFQLFANQLSLLSTYPTVQKQRLDKSKIIIGLKNQIAPFFKQPIKQINLLYRASQHQFQVQKFWERCKRYNNLVIIKTQYNKIIGGFTPIPWDKKFNGYKSDRNIQTFIFSLSQKQKFKIISGRQEYMTFHNNKFGPIFGGGHDLIISNRANENRQSSANICQTFGNSNYTYNQKQSWKRFTGSSDTTCFRIEQWQVYQIRFE